MCGLFGIAGRGILNADLDILEQLGVVNMLRGTDSTGLLQGNLGGKFSSYKVEKDDIPFFDFHYYYKSSKTGMLSKLTDNLFMVHVRAATRGSIKKENSHPFEFPDFVAMHNGTLKDKQYQSKEKTDSELFFKDFQTKLNLEGNEEKEFEDVLADHLSSLDKDSAFAITLMSKDDGKIYFMRNKFRSLSCAISLQRDVMYWSSEKGALEYILNRNKMELGKDYTLSTFDEGKIFKFDVLDIAKGQEKIFYTTDIPKPPEVEEEVFVSKSDLPWWEKREKSKHVHFRSKCVSCQRDMNLYDMHKGHTIDGNKNQYQCSHCYNLSESLKVTMH